jgi:hypothetical protein
MAACSGAGNLVLPKLPEGGKSPASPGLNSRSASSSDVSSLKQETRSYGRGGAGNFDWSNEAEKKREEAIRLKMDQIRQTAEQDVDNELSRPGKAVLRASDELDSM